MTWILFAFVGGLIAVVMIITLLQTGELILIPLLFIPIVFLALGVYNVSKELDKRAAKKRILNLGKACSGYIVGHEKNWHSRINNRPVLNVVIEIYDGTEKITGTFKTNTTRESKYPIGSVVDVYKYEGDYAWDRKVKGQATDAKLDNLGIEVIHKGY